jgi:hypothetical protein
LRASSRYRYGPAGLWFGNFWSRHTMRCEAEFNTR